MINKRIYVCEDSIEGIFTAIYNAWDSRYGHDNIRIDIRTDKVSMTNYELFADYIEVTPDYDKSEKVANSIRKKISEEAYDMVCSAVLTDCIEKGDIIYRFLIVGFKIGAKVVNYLSNEPVMNIFELNRNVFYESHHFLGFLRFAEIYNNILFAKISPKNDIIRLIAPHFADRLPNENFIIYDEKRESAIVKRSGLSWVYIISDEFNFDSILETSKEEESFKQLWKTFFDTIAIKERENYKLQRNNLPKRFRNNMTEFNLISKPLT